MPEIAPAVRRFADKSLCEQSISPGLLQPADKKDHENLIGKRSRLLCRLAWRECNGTDVDTSYRRSKAR